MSGLLARHFIENAIKEINKTREEILKETNLNSKPHFIPLNEEILVATLKDKFVNSYSVTRFLEDLNKHYLNVSAKFTLDSINGKLYYGNEEIGPNRIKQVTPAKVLENGKLIGLLFAANNSFASAQSSLFNGFLNKHVAKYLKGVRKLRDNQLGFDVGHIYFGPENEPVLGKTPSGMIVDNALGNVAKAADKFYSNETLSPTQISTFENLFNKVSSAVQDFRVHTTYSQTIQQNLTKSFTDSLLSVKANIVIIQEQSENRGSFGSDERRYVEAVRKALNNTSLEDLHFSRNLVEEIETRAVSAITGKTVPNTKSSVKSTSKKTNTNTSKSSTKPINTSIKVLNLETKRAIGLPRLLAILNSHIQDVVSANMQDPDDYDKGSRRLLTYRTGRFASSVKVDRLNISRAGMITAFYSYMKNPYATFSIGGRQQNPRSRDPKSLISKSIRDIAAKYVAERMRAVNV